MNDPINRYDNIPKLEEVDLKEIELRLKDARDQAQVYIREYPLTSVAIALGLGYIIGRMFSKK